MGVTIGVFDSGFGGLTVLRELLPLIPGARYLYLGDTARLPYGSKSRATIARYATSSVQFLLDRGADVVVVACNTATALALPEIEAVASPRPVVGVIEPGVRAAAEARLETGELQHVLVLATAATVESHAYALALGRLGLRVTEKACPLLVPLVEEGWIDHPVTAEVVRIYLAEALAAAPQTEALVLGCTHYPLLAPMMERTLTGLGHPLRIIDSAQATARAVAATVAAGIGGGGATGAATCAFFASDSVGKFERLGERFLGRPLERVELIDLGG